MIPILLVLNVLHPFIIISHVPTYLPLGLAGVASGVASEAGGDLYRHSTILSPPLYTYTSAAVTQ